MHCMRGLSLWQKPAQPMDNDEEMHDFRARLKTLQHVAVEIADAVDEQSRHLGGSETMLRRSLGHISKSLGKMGRASKRGFSANTYMVFAGVLLALIFYMLFVAL